MTLTLSVWVGAVITLCCFSFLYRDNPFYRFAEHLFVGVSAGYYFSLISFHQVLKPNLLAKIMPAQFATGAAATAAPEYMLLIPGFMGLLMLFRFSAAYSWVSRFTVAFVMGVSTGLGIVYSVQQYLMPQIAKAIRPIVVAGDFFQSFSNLVLVVGSVACLFYFFFSTEHRGPVYGNVARVGIWYLMLSFGAAFGATVMGRISLLIGRFHFLLHDWLNIV
ncbi:MAG TPA: hypothetical protein PKC25_01580 [Candidatus Rifleibacterium sp.]|jgi:hypothetical protein|nr:hypothetical protein [Candidatus Rifleibacterium sp.]